MAHSLKKIFGILLVLAFVSGCAATKDVSVRAYKQDKARVDQEIYGNQGYLFGEPVDSDEYRKETRKIYVLEFTKEAPRPVSVDYDENYERIEAGDPATLRQPRTESIPSRRTQPKVVRKEIVAPEINLPSFDDEEFEGDDDAVEYSDTPDGPTRYQDYTVTKDDTLQKIAKKFYDSYSKWPRIYEANKSVIKNPDRIKPGIVLRIPVD